MAFQSVPNTVLLTAVYGSSTLEWTNNYHFQRTDFDLADMEALASTMWYIIQTEGMADVCEEFALKKLRLYGLRAIDDIYYEYEGSSAPGQNIDTPLPLALAVVASLRTAVRGRSGRGRLYLTGYCENNIADGVWMGQLPSNVEDFLDVVKTGSAQNGWAWGIVSRQLDNVIRELGEFIYITSVEIRNNLPGSQRRRTRRP